MHYRTFIVALGASVALHAGGISLPMVYEWVTGQPWHVARLPELPHKVPVEFVDAPHEMEEAKHTPQTNKISNKQTQARDSQVDETLTSYRGPAFSLLKESQQLAKRTPAQVSQQAIPLQPRPQQGTLEKQQKETVEFQKEQQGQPPQQYQLGETRIFNLARNQDTYSSPEIQKFLATAIHVGEASFDAKKHVLGPYLKQLKSRIAPLWRLKLETQPIGNLLTEKKVVLGFQIRPNGTLAQILILEDHGDDLFNQICIRTVQEASPFDPLPAAWLEQTKLSYLNLIYSFVVF